MKFGVRECANIVFRAKQPIRIGTATFQAGQPVLYIDTATTSSMEQSTTTVYAQGGRGNSRLLAWEGQKTLTFSFTDALLSPIGFAILSGAGLFKRGDSPDGTEDDVHFHMTSNGATLKVTETQGATEGEVIRTGTIDLRTAVAELGRSAKICVADAPIYIMETESDGSLTGNIISGTITPQGGVITINDPKVNGKTNAQDSSVTVDYYVDLPGKHVWEADITPETFGGNYYVEADTLFRDQHTGADLPANLTFPNVRLQSNFTMTFAGSGDPSTFDFTMDAFPDYTYFDQKKKVLCAMQIVDTINMGADATAVQVDNPVMYHDETPEQMAEAAAHDSNITVEDLGANIAQFNWKRSGASAQESETAYIYKVGDAINFGDFVTLIDNNGKEVSLSTLAPEFTTASSTAGDYISWTSDGYIIGKQKTTTGVSITATLPASTTESSTVPLSKTLVVIVEPAVANG